MAATVTVPFVQALLAAGRAAGVAVDDLIQRFDLGDALSDPDGRVCRSVHNDLWEEISTRSGDPFFGLHFAERAEPGALAVLDYAVRNAPTLREGCIRSLRYCKLVHDGVEVYLRESGDLATHGYSQPAFPGGSPRHAAEFVIGLFVQAIRQMLHSGFCPERVRFEHPRPSDVSEHRRVFGCLVEFNADGNEMVFARHLLDREVVRADPNLIGLLDRYAQQLLAKLPQTEDFVSKVRRIVADAMRGGDPSLELVAKRLHMSPRTLQRRLRDEGTSHNELLDAMRRELAQKYLREPTIAIGETAFLLGFSEPSAFHRAFKRWTGSTPGEFRKSSPAPA